MRRDPREWIFISNPALMLYSYHEMNEYQAIISGVGKIYNDRVSIGDTIIIETKSKRRVNMVVENINFIGHTFDAVVTIPELKEK